MKIVISGVVDSGVCDLTGRTGECLRVTSEDGFIRSQVQLSFKAFMQQVRLIAKQEQAEHQAQSGSPRPKLAE